MTAVVLADDDHFAQCRRVRRRGPQHLQVVVATEAIGGDVDMGARLDQDEFHFLGAVEVDDRHRDRTEHRQAPEGSRRLDPIRQLQRHDVPGPDPEGPEPGRGAERHLVGFPDGAPPRSDARPDPELEIGHLREPSVDVLAEPVVDPVAGVPIALRELRVGRARAPRHDGSSMSTGPDATHRAVLVGHRHVDRHDAHTEDVVLSPTRDGAVDEGHVAHERRRAVLELRVPDEAVVTGPERRVVEGPRPNRRAVPVAAWQPDDRRRVLIDVPARRAAEHPVALRRVDLRQLLVAHHLGEPSTIDAAEVAPEILRAAPDHRRERAPLGGERLDRVRTDRAGGERQAGIHVRPPRRGALPARVDPGQTPLVQRGELLGRPGRLDPRLLAEVAPSTRFLDEVPHRGGALLRDDLASLVHVGVVAASEHGGPGKPRLGHAVVVVAPMDLDLVAGYDAGTVEPPLVPTEDHVRSGDLAEHGWHRAVSDVGVHHERLRRDDPAESRRLRVVDVIVQRVRVLHPLDPAPDVVDRHGLAQLAAPEGLADVLIEIARVDLHRLVHTHRDLRDRPICISQRGR